MRPDRFGRHDRRIAGQAGATDTAIAASEAAADPDQLARLQDVVARHLERFAFRWRPVSLRALRRGSLGGMRHLAWIAGIVLAVAGGGVQAAIGPVPPCAGAPVPAPAADAGGPVAVLWHRDELPAGWQPAACGGLTVGPGAVLVGVAARLPEGARPAVLLVRLAAVSTHTGIVYIDPAGGTARPLLNAATALDGPDPASRRPDFKADEIVAGAVLHMLVDDAQAGEVVYRIDVRAAGPDGIDLLVANESTVRWMGMAVAQPGQLASLFSVTRDDAGRLVYYSLTASELAGWAAGGIDDATLLARALGWFRFLTAD